MKIRTRLAISAILPLGLFFIIVSMYVYTGRQVDHVRHKGETAAQIRRNVSDLSFIVQHRLLRHEIQRETPLNQVETTLATLISRQRSESPAESIILKRLRQDQQDINLLLSRLEMLWTQKGVKTTETVELENQLTAQVLERIREMASDAERLEKEATKEAAGAEKRANLIILGLTGFFSALALVISLSIMRRTSAALARIEEGTQIIGKGDMDHVIPIIADDELGHLSYAFNEMTGELRKSYAALQQEVIARSQSEEAVRRQAELIELSREAIIVKDLTGKILFWSNGAEETYGWTKTEALGKITHSLLKSRFPMPFDEYMAFLTRHGRWQGELIHTRKNGSELIVLSRHGLQNDEAGQAAAILEINFDITERKRAEIALQASEERWATTLASIGDAVISTDIAGKIMFMNAIAEAITGWTMTEALNKPISEIFRIMDEEKRREAENPVTKVFREGAIAGLATPTLLIKKDGTEIPIDHSGAPIRDKDGIAQGVVLVFRDITDRRRAEDNLRREIEERKKAEEHLRQSQKMEAIGTLAGGIAHDFNNVLAAILGFAEMAAENIANHPAEAMNNLQNVLKASLRARDLVKQILS
ncbi:MAG: PAS domain S-box protein, partial [Syntrophorhabdus sp.]